MFTTHHPRRFKTHTPRTQGTSIVVNGSRVTDPGDVLDHWATHFSNLGESRCSSNSLLNDFVSHVPDLEAESFRERDLVLDSPIEITEVDHAICRLKSNSAGGPDSLSPRHLKYSGPLLRKWICNIFNAIISMEHIPFTFKYGIIIPVNKGKAKDPVLQGNYRGITLSSVLAKCSEFVLLDRIVPVLSESNLPQLNQTAFQKGISCSDAIFSCQESISKFVREDDSVYSCFYDLASAFDTVEYPVLLDHLALAGIVGNTWRLIKQWYTNPKSCVRLNGSTSRYFSVNCGVRQGSVLSPLLFLLIMDPILQQLKSKSCGLSICGLYLGAFCHADDIRTLSSSLTECSAQINHVANFATSRGLSLNVAKCEAVISPPHRCTRTSIGGDDVSIPVTNAARCLGAWWTPDLSSSVWIENNIKKARGAFFARGQGVFRGSLNPLSSRSIVESLVSCRFSCMVVTRGF